MYPIYLQLKGRRCLVVGAGHVAQRRVQALLEQGAAVTVIAPEPMPAIWEGTDVTYCQASYEKRQMTPEYALVFACVNDMAVNDQIVADAQELGILACTATQGTRETDFLVPAMRQASQLSLAVSTGGCAPVLAAAICQALTPTLSTYAAICEPLEQLRQRWKQTVSDGATRHALLRQMTEAPALAQMQQGGVAAYLAYGTRLEQQLQGKAAGEKRAIVVVSFGTSYANTLDKTIGAVEEAIQQTFPTDTVVRAFTSGIIRRKLAQRGVEIDDVASALQRLVQEGYTHVYCQPTHLIPGDEYEKLCRDAAPYGDCFETLQIGTPLLTAPADYPALLAAMIPMVEHSTHTAYVFMGHGTTHLANAAYPAFDNYWRYHGYDNVFVGTVEGYPTLDTILALLQKGGYRRVVLSPMMLVAGDHAQNDMAGPAPDSWASVLAAQGYQVETRLQGLGEYPAIQALYVAHVAQMLASDE